MIVVESSYERDLYENPVIKRFEDVEEAAKHFESEAEPSTPELATYIELLGSGQGLEALNKETGKTVWAYELVEAVA